MNINEKVSYIHKEYLRAKYEGDIKEYYLLRAIMRLMKYVPSIVSETFHILKDHEKYFVGYTFLLNRFERLYKNYIFTLNPFDKGVSRSLVEYAYYQLKEDI